MSLSQRLTELISACFTGLWVQSYERQDALEEIAQMCRQENWRLSVWDIERGLRVPAQANAPAVDAGGSDPLAAIRSINALAAADSSAILVLVNFHRFLQSAEIVQALEQQITVGKQNRTFIIVLSPVVQIPCELERAFCVVEHELPDRAQLEAIARGIATQEGELPEGNGPGCRAGGRLRHDAMRGGERLQLEPCPAPATGGRHDLAAQGGRAKEKQPAHAAPRRRDVRRPRGPGSPQGLLPPGAAAQAGRQAQGPGNRLGRAAGNGEVRHGQGIGHRNGPADADPRSGQPAWVRWSARPRSAPGRPCGSSTPSAPAWSSSTRWTTPWPGTTPTATRASCRRFFGQMQTWLNDHTSDAFVVCTSNDVSTLPAAFTRAERFDGLFYVGLARRGAAAGHLADLLPEVWAGPQPAEAGRRRLQRGRDQGLLPAGGAAGRLAGRGGPERGARGPDGPRVGRAAAAVGLGPLPVGRRAGHLQGQRQ